MQSPSVSAKWKDPWTLKIFQMNSFCDILQISETGMSNDWNCALNNNMSPLD